MSESRALCLGLCPKAHCRWQWLSLGTTLCGVDELLHNSCCLCTLVHLWQPELEKLRLGAACASVPAPGLGASLISAAKRRGGDCPLQDSVERGKEEKLSFLWISPWYSRNPGETSLFFVLHKRAGHTAALTIHCSSPNSSCAPSTCLYHSCTSLGLLPSALTKIHSVSQQGHFNLIDGVVFF